ncbi:peptidoglycan-binding domain-containing protein [Nocardia nepalensis]|uniref:peptidoglycan-binding domain-containing protein n=1 Tax=Nocardia nepalensis TaxID=3375448 RepID=UPI003B67DA2A
MNTQQLSGSTRIRRAIAAAAVGIAAVAGGVAVQAPAHAAVYASSINECLAFRPTLREWVTHQAQCVAAVQWYLSWDFGNDFVNVDGKFGPQTKEAVKNFQKDRHITVDGVVGPVTWQALQDTCWFTGFCDEKWPYPLPD